MSRFPRSLKLALPLVLAAAAAPMFAQMPMEQPGKMDKSRIVAGTYTADAGHAQIGWRLNHMGFNDTLGLIGGETGTLVLDPANPAAAKVSVTIPVSALVAANPALTAHLFKPAPAGGKADFFGAAPADASFVSTTVAPNADGTSAKVTGNLTLNGVTKPVTLDTKFVGAGANMMNKAPTVGFHAETTIKRSDFGLATYVPMVSDEVQITVSMAFEKKS